MGTVIESDVSGTSQNPGFNFDQLTPAEREELETWLKRLQIDWVEELEIKNTEEEQRLQQQAQQAAEDEEYFNAASAYEMRF